MTRPETADERVERVERLRSEIADGTYAIDRTRLAACLATLLVDVP